MVETYICTSCKSREQSPSSSFIDTNIDLTSAHRFEIDSIRWIINREPLLQRIRIRDIREEASD